MPFYLYEIRHTIEDGNDCRVYEAGFWAPTEPDAESHLRESMEDACDRLVDAVTCEADSIDPGYSDDGDSGFWITWQTADEDYPDEDPFDHHNHLAYDKPRVYETPADLDKHRSRVHETWAIDNMEND